MCKGQPLLDQVLGEENSVLDVWRFLECAVFVYGLGNASGFNKIRIEIIHYCEAILEQQMQGRSWNVFVTCKKTLCDS